MNSEANKFPEDLAKCAYTAFCKYTGNKEAEFKNEDNTYCEALACLWEDDTPSLLYEDDLVFAVHTSNYDGKALIVFHKPTESIALMSDTILCNLFIDESVKEEEG